MVCPFRTYIVSFEAYRRNVYDKKFTVQDAGVIGIAIYTWDGVEELLRCLPREHMFDLFVRAVIYDLLSNSRVGGSTQAVDSRVLN